MHICSLSIVYILNKVSYISSLYNIHLVHVKFPLSGIRQLFSYIIGYTIYFQFFNIILNNAVWERNLCTRGFSHLLMVHFLGPSSRNGITGSKSMNTFLWF